MGETTGRLTTHVLDTASGKPAAGLVIELFSLDHGQRHHLKTVTTNGDGRIEGPILEGAALKAGIYELVFHAGNYFRQSGATWPEPVFLGDIPIRFGIAAPHEHYHVPLLLSPYGYSTYRGS